jgi:glycosyltransferase 2 family protein
MWAIYGGIVYCVLYALGFVNSGIAFIDDNPIGATLIILLVTTIGFTIPGAPGGVGTYHGVTVLGMSLFGVPGEKAAGFALVLHALNYIPLTVLGLIFFWKLGLSFRGAGELAATAESPPEPQVQSQKSHVDVNE